MFLKLAKANTILLDCYGTLCDESHIFDDTFSYIAGRSGITRAKLKRDFHTYRQIVNQSIKHQMFLTQRERYRIIFEHSLAAVRDPNFIAIATDYLMDQFAMAEVFPEVCDILCCLRRNYRLCMLTNGDNECIEQLLSRNGLELDLVITSEVARSYKPNPLIFQTALSKLKIDRAEALMVGNDFEKDIVGALNVGIAAVWLNRSKTSWISALTNVDETSSINDLHELVALLS